MRHRPTLVMLACLALCCATALRAAEPPQDASAPSAQPDTAAEARLLVVRPGDTLIGLLTGAGAAVADAHAAVAGMARHLQPTSLRPGDEVAIRLTPDDPPGLTEVEVEPEPGRTVRATRSADGSWQALESVAPRSRFVVRAEGEVAGGLFPAMTAAGVPAGLALSLVRVLGHQVDFQRDLRAGDRFAILFERFRDSDGDLLGHGQILHAELTLSGRQLAVWRHKDGRGTTDWYDAQGRSLRTAFLRTPLDGARISSGYGMRSHPILGYTRMHRGIDFAAPTGTRVYAAADGVVVSAKRDRGYGLVVRLRHAGGYETLYAHLSRFASGLRSGQRVRQGAVIGAVGSTGMSTGPHLHYEILARGRNVNPAAHVRHTVRLGGRELARFRAHQRSLDRIAGRLGAQQELALAAD